MHAVSCHPIFKMPMSGFVPCGILLFYMHTFWYLEISSRFHHYSENCLLIHLEDKAAASVSGCFRKRNLENIDQGKMFKHNANWLGKRNSVCTIFCFSQSSGLCVFNVHKSCRQGLIQKLLSCTLFWLGLDPPESLRRIATGANCNHFVNRMAELLQSQEQNSRNTEVANSLNQLIRGETKRPQVYIVH